MTLRRKMFFVIALTIAYFVAVVFLTISKVAVPKIIEGENVFLLAQNSMQNLILVLLLAGILAGALIMLLLDKLLLSRLGRLSNSISKIGTGGNFSSRINIQGNDELSTLASEVNGMLTALEWSHHEHLESEARLRRITDNMLDMIAQTDVKWNYLYVSPSHKSVLGYEPEEMLKRKYLDFVHPEDKRRVEAFMQEALKTYTLGSIEFRCKSKKGEYFWIESVGNFLFDGDGRITGAIFASRDITERKRAEEALKESDEKYREIMEVIEEGYYEIDLEGCFTFVNDSLCRITGYSRRQLMNSNIRTLTGGQGEVEDSFKQVALTGNAEKGIIWNMAKKDGSEIIMEISVSPIKDKEENQLGFCGLVRDVTESKLAEAKIRKMNEELERRVAERTAQLEYANKELEAFSYSVSHDLRTPLRSIDGFSTALMEDYSDNLDSVARDYLNRVRAASQRMGQLIDDLLNLSRVTRSKMSFETINLSAMVEEILAEFKQDDPGRIVDIIIEPDLFTRGDKRLLRVLLENLLGNAWKFTSKKASSIIEFGVLDKGDEPVYFVRDNGAGFDMAYADKLFGAFQRLHKADEFAGTGIGLATVARIVHRHGGHAWAEAALNKGATFYFTLDKAIFSGGGSSEQKSYIAG
jgi:PAS domain S-box-containing protein